MLLNLHNISKSFGDVHALRNISCTLDKGEWLTIMGPSGSGKSTLLHIIALLDSPTSGTYTLFGNDMTHLSEEAKIGMRREKIGLIFQQFHLIPYLSAVENVMLAQYYHSSIDRDDALTMLDKVGLSHRAHHLPSELSGGEQQRLCIARAMMNNPEILLADEPTGNLDSENEARVLALLQEFKKEGKSLVLITHNPELGSYGDKKLLLKHGEMQ
ncbi:MAG: ABC transporter ATP-binding protein [Helicobacter sp.]|nr:ABC transporter ATP-binding protein [Helicobacter sp.]MBD5167622.1 ABC transporter ATP-binding protein [Helicobacter sp.]MDE6045326.1 ABC transporter ATP-binding protein [Helicobacter sp.]MDE7196626.1 ABC transporter ATP-binding protein [Helicobacter sp.]MDE7447777.1 ABC transporter ATP-binding protein [Helicobacter sp.]